MHLADITSKYISKPFRECPCMVLVYNLYKDVGVDLPDHYGDLTLKNYMDAYKEKPYDTQLKLLEVVKSLGKKSSAQYPTLLDLLVVAQNPHRKGVVRPGFMPAVYVGGGNCLTSFLKYGVTKMELNHNNKAIIARTVIECPN